MNTLQIGNGVEFKILDANLNPITFKLAVFARKRWYGDKTEEFEFGYISEDKQFYARSCYSGGNTGFGISDYEINKAIPEEFRLVTTDIEEIINIAKKEEADRLQEKENYNKKQAEKAARINTLPKEIEVTHPDLKDVCAFERSEANYTPSYSRQIKGGNYTLRLKNFNRKIWLKDFITKSGALQAKQFANYNSEFKRNPKEYLECLISQMKELEQTVKNA